MGIGTIINIDVENIANHPQNPRRDLGDMAELVDSIRKNGVMQNITVVPIEAPITGGPGYYALLGNRRLAAAKTAGLKEVPCRIITGMGIREQVEAMLMENMQRNDLTVYEQAQ